MTSDADHDAHARIVAELFRRLWEASHAQPDDQDDQEDAA